MTVESSGCMTSKPETVAGGIGVDNGIYQQLSFAGPSLQRLENNNYRNKVHLCCKNSHVDSTSGVLRILESSNKCTTQRNQHAGGLMHRFLAALSLVLSLIGTGYADTIVSRDFTPGNNYININSPEGISWTQASTYDDVSISGFFAGVGLSGGAGTVYLMDQIGPGTTTSNEIASTTFSATFGQTSSTLLFSGLTLGPGTYYLLMLSDNASNGTAGPGGIAWAVPDAFTDTTAPGASIGSGFVVFSSAPYAPASDITPISSLDFALSVSGNSAAAVPEPSSLMLLGTGALTLFGPIRRRLLSR
jgi:hypothetical protein